MRRWRCSTPSSCTARRTTTDSSCTRSRTTPRLSLTRSGTRPRRTTTSRRAFRPTSAAMACLTWTLPPKTGAMGTSWCSSRGLPTRRRSRTRWCTLGLRWHFLTIIPTTAVVSHFFLWLNWCHAYKACLSFAVDVRYDTMAYHHIDTLLSYSYSHAIPDVCVVLFLKQNERRKLASHEFEMENYATPIDLVLVQGKPLTTKQ